MKIGILTLPLHTNYGGILQAYALQTILEKRGHIVYILDANKQPNIRPWYIRPIIWLYRAYLRYIRRINTPIFDENSLQKAYSEYLITSQYTQRFINQYLHIRPYKHLSEIQENEFDAIIVGSDQVWRPKYYFGKDIKEAYLSFTKNWNIKRIAYAVSFGTDIWEYNATQTNECKNYIKKFEAVSVREKSGQELCKKYFEIDTTQVLDPTMLLDKQDYIQLIKKDITPKNILLTYLIDDNKEKQDIVAEIAKAKKLTPLCANSKIEDSQAPIKERIQPPVERWIKGFAEAKFIVTDSFHACIFAILFNKPFIAIGNKDRGLSRFQSLLEIFGLEKHLILSIHELNPNNDYQIPQRAYDILQTQRFNSLSFISNHLN